MSCGWIRYRDGWRWHDPHIHIRPLRQLTPELARQEVILFRPADPIRGVYDATIQYYLAQPADSVMIEILDAEGAIVNTFKGKPSRNGQRRGGGPSTDAGLNTFSWDLNYPGATTFDGMIIWSARPARGPKAPLGDYQVRLTVGDYSKSYPFTIKIDPNLKGITADDLRQQFELAVKIRDKTTQANEAVIQIRNIRSQVTDRLAKLPDATDLRQQATTMMDKLTTIEEALYQTKNRSNQDPLNFPIRLNNRLASLRRSVETGDARPTNGAYQVFEELSRELAGHLKDLNAVLDKDLPALNSRLVGLTLPAIQAQ